MRIGKAIGAAVTGLLAAVVTIGIIVAVGIAAGDDADLTYRTLDYETTILPDGGLRIEQHIDMRLRERDDDDGDARPWKQLYQQYRLSADGLADITDISVRNVTDGTDYTRTDPATPDGIGDAQWDADYAGHWYIADVTDSAADPQLYEPGRDGYALDGPGRLPDVGGDSGDTATDASADSRLIEIGWNIPVTTEADSLRFDVTMTFVGAVTRYDDIAAFQWEPVGVTNPIPVGTLTGVVRFPDGVAASDAPAWLHSAGAADTTRDDDGTLRFTIRDIRAGQYVDLVAAYPADATRAPDGWADTAVGTGGDWIRRGDGDRLDALTASETVQEQAWRDSQRVRARISVIAWSIAAVVGVSIAVAALVLAIRNRRAAQYHGDVDIRYDPPAMSPAAAARMADFLHLDATAATEHGDDDQTLETRQLTATLLSLAAKHAIAIHPGPAKLYRGIDLAAAAPARLALMISADSGRLHDAGTTSTIVLLRDDPGRYESDDADADAAGGTAGTQTVDGSGRSTAIDASTQSVLTALDPARDLTPSERALLHLLHKIGRRLNTRVFDMRQMRKTCKKWKSGYKTLADYTQACTDEYDALDATEPRRGATIIGLAGCAIAVIGAIVAVAGGNATLAIIFGTPLLAVSVAALCVTSQTVLTDRGQALAGDVIGFHRYLAAYGTVGGGTAFGGTADDDRAAVPQLQRCDQYLVYATAFGFSGRLLADLADAYPQLVDPDWLDAYAASSPLYWSYRPYGWYGIGWGYRYGDDFDGPSDGRADGRQVAGDGMNRRAGAGSDGDSGISDGRGPIGGVGPSAFGLDVGDFGTQLAAGFADLTATIQAAAPTSDGGSGGLGGSGGSFSGGSFGGSSGGAGGGSFGGR
ncbi:DUF2207 family protein [Bifidobacterium samirii]|uniref:DUF2207 domain-containing protein n=1 Tax=Bifidobacterium samirii TaxID=2306974 RepID=A0A430FRC4_9BIFI|nr:DUF2207 domain-containing protein [Bifidobacterium samirii]RSX55402.1 hypothetical protein D2E24_1306 [Bifidobacterium samirii]